MKKITKAIIPAERIINQIYLIRNKKVMLDFDLAEMYQVETKVLNQAVKRNQERFPDDFMFQLNKEEFEMSEHHSLRSQNVTLKKKRGEHKKYLPYVFTEQGVAMLSSILKSKIAIQVNIAIIRTFTKLREIFATNKQLRIKIEKMEAKFQNQDKKFQVVFEAIKQLAMNKEEEKKHKTEIGFKVS